MIEKYKMRFNPSHQKYIEEFIAVGENSISAQDLAQKALDTGKVKKVLLALNQEFANRVGVILFMEMTVQDLEDLVNEGISMDNIERAVTKLESYDSGIIKGAQTAKTIIECLRIILTEEQRRQKAQEPSILDKTSRAYVRRIVNDYQVINTFIRTEGKNHHSKYLVVLREVKKFLGIR